MMRYQARYVTDATADSSAAIGAAEPRNFLDWVRWFDSGRGHPPIDGLRGQASVARA